MPQKEVLEKLILSRSGQVLGQLYSGGKALEHRDPPSFETDEVLWNPV